MKKAILLTNLGSPDSTSTKDVRKFLREFLIDGRVIDIPRFPRWLLVNGIIAPFRSPVSAKKYKRIWMPEGSPLVVITEKLTKEVESVTGIPTYMCMRYGNPSPEAAFQKIMNEHPDVDQVVLFPLYPHYAMSSFETAVEHVKKVWMESPWSFELKLIAPYYNYPGYIDALVGSIKTVLDEGFDYLLFSYHGVPERQILKSDITGQHCLKSPDCCKTPSPAHQKCYRHQVYETTRLVVEKLKLSTDRYGVSFQSRLGSDKWLGPATADVLKQLPQQGVKKLLVITPAFVSDCLETLEEISIEGEETFYEAGGEDFKVILCLNLNADWIETIRQLVV